MSYVKQLPKLLFLFLLITTLSPQPCHFSIPLLVPPSIRSNGPADRSVILHKSIILQCLANGIPAPAITWLKDGLPVTSTPGHLKVAVRSHLGSDPLFWVP